MDRKAHWQTVCTTTATDAGKLGHSRNAEPRPAELLDAAGLSADT